MIRTRFALAVAILALAGWNLQPDQEIPIRERIEITLGVLAADSMEGRRTGTAGSRRASAFIAVELERYGVEPGMNGSFFQPVPLVSSGGESGRLSLVTDRATLDTIPQDRRVQERNVVGVIPGIDPDLSNEYIVVGAHFDHVGIGAPVNGDSIFNGADDDGSGTVAAMEVARALVREPTGRSVIVLLTTAEEMGILGTRLFVERPTVPLDQLVADLQIEMIGRPDELAGGFGRAWLTGYERTTMGDLLQASGSPIVPDPRLDQGFYSRSDNIVFALAGIPAHTISSFNLHTDYHRPSDEVDKIDFDHMTAVVEATIDMVRALGTGPRPEWHPGGRPGG